MEQNPPSPQKEEKEMDDAAAKAKAERMNDPTMVAIRKEKEEEAKAYELSKEAADMGLTENTALAPDVINLNLDMGIPTAPIQSLCINCEEQGETKFMMTHIPFFKEIMISAFACDHCGYKNSEVTFAGKLEDYGCRYEVNVINAVAFNRTIVKSEFATITVPECGLEMPPATQKGSIKTMEGYFMTTIEGLQEVQEQRRLIDPATADKIDEYCDTLREFAEGKRFPFKFIVEDPSGNSYVQNPSAPTADQYCKKTQWVRTIDEYTVMGYPADQASIMAEEDRLASEANRGEKKGQYHDFISRDTRGTKQKAQTKEEQEKLLTKVATYSKRSDDTQKAATDANYVDFSKPIDEQDDKDALADDDPRKQVSRFEVPCYNCDKMGAVQMCFSSIPFFKEIVLICFCCDFCGYRNSEIKEGGGMGDKGKKITLTVSEESDLNRDVFKSNTAAFQIPEIGFDMEIGSMGSCFTTVEGLLMKAHDELQKNNPFGKGDSKTDGQFLEFLDKMNTLREGKKLPFTIVLDDPADNCFVYNPFAPKDDPKLLIEMYERTEEQKDDLGITHMETDPEIYAKKQMEEQERSFIMIKPDGVQRGQVGKIISRFEQKGFKLIAMKLCQPGRGMFAKHYADLQNKSFFKGLINYASSGPVCCMVWEGQNVVKTGRKMLGATKPYDSNPATNRGDFCIDVGRNAIHGSDSIEAANDEISLWFKDEELVNWGQHSEKWVYENPASN